ncbi:uncharacterized protein LOC144173863 [Haemaphysalis longicornis]
MLPLQFIEEDAFQQFVKGSGKFFFCPNWFRFILMDAINGVCSLFSGTCPEVTLMSRRTLGRRIDDAFQQKLGDIKRKVLQATSVCTTTDVWSTSTNSFMGVTAHWIDFDTLERRSAALACKRFIGTHSYDRVADLLLDVYADFNLETSKIVGTMTDNGSNTAMAKCTLYWDSPNWPKSAEVVASVLGRQLSTPCVTHWSSLYHALDVLLTDKEKLKTLSEKLDLPQFRDTEFDFLDEYRGVLYPIAAAIDVLQKSLSGYYKELLPTIVTVEKKLLAQKGKVRHGSVILDSCLSGLQKRFSGLFKGS